MSLTCLSSCHRFILVFQAADEPAALATVAALRVLAPEDVDLDVLLSVPDLLPVELATVATQPLDRERVIRMLTQTNLASHVDGTHIRFL